LPHAPVVLDSPLVSRVTIKRVQHCWKVRQRQFPFVVVIKMLAKSGHAWLHLPLVHSVTRSMVSMCDCNA